MAKVNNYAEKLKDPRWQKIRLQVFERDEWTCQKCFSKDDTLCVHHFRYIPGREPWEYNLTNFVTLCFPCHELEKESRIQYESDLLEILKEKGFLADDISELCDGFLRLKISRPPEVFATFLKWLLKNDLLIEKLTDLYFEDIEGK